MQEEQLRKPEKLRKQMKATAAYINPGFDDDQKMGRKLQPSELWHLTERTNLEGSPPKYKLIQRQPEAQKSGDSRQINSMTAHHNKMKNPENILRESMLEEATSPKPYISVQNRHDIEQSPLQKKQEDFDNHQAQFESFFDRDEEQKRRNNSIAEWGQRNQD